MEVPVNHQEMERMPFEVFSADELSALRGIDYQDLPNNFTMSETVLSACLDVWKAYENYEPIHESKARQRLANYFKTIEEQAGEQDKEFIKRSKTDLENIEKDMEFGKQIYKVGDELIVGAVHPGVRGRILLRNKRDGIDDSKSVASIHNHLNDMMTSVGDIMNIVSDLESVPEKCLYLVITPNHIRLLFPTNETVRYPNEGLRDFIREKFGHIYEEAAKDINEYGGQEELIEDLAKFFKLGYYVGDKNLRLRKLG